MNIIQVIVGLALALFIPGYLIARAFFKELSELEKIALAFVLSISLDIAVGLFLGYNEPMKNFTGGITAFNLWIYLGALTVILFGIYAYRENDELTLAMANSKNFLNNFRRQISILLIVIIIVFGILLAIFMPLQIKPVGYFILTAIYLISIIFLVKILRKK
jgi:uncharacterized membrane protein